VNYYLKVVGIGNLASCQSIDEDIDAYFDGFGEGDVSRVTLGFGV